MCLFIFLSFLFQRAVLGAFFFFFFFFFFKTGYLRYKFIKVFFFFFFSARSRCAAACFCVAAGVCCDIIALFVSGCGWRADWVPCRRRVWRAGVGLVGAGDGCA
jgi:hypothetical protein